MHDRLEGDVPDDRLTHAVGLFRARRLEEARAVCERVIEETGRSGGRAALAAYWAARCVRRLERPDEALRYLYLGASALEGRPEGEVACRLRAETIHTWSALGKNEDALKQADELIRLAERVGTPTAQAVAAEAFAGVHWMTMDWDRGRSAYRTALALAESCGDLELVVLSTMGLAACEEGVAEQCFEAGRDAEGATCGRRALDLQLQGRRLADQLGDSYLVMYADLNTACTLHAMRDFDAAAVRLRRIIDDPQCGPVQANALAVLGRVLIDRGEPRAALERLQAGLVTMEKEAKLYPRLQALEYLVDAHEAVGDHVAALACMRRYHALFVRNATDKARVQASAMQVKYETERVLAVAQAQRERAERLERTNAALVHEAAFHARAAMHDALTGVTNRRGFDRALDAAVQARGQAPPCSVTLVDVDHFKRVNDVWGHLVGDEVLRRVAALVQLCSRPGEVVARYGGDEFVVLAHPARAADAVAIGEQICRTVAGHDWGAVVVGLAVTVSLGLAVLDEIPDGGDAEQGAPAIELMWLADRRLYAAKRAGRNRVVGPVAGPPAAEPAGGQSR